MTTPHNRSRVIRLSIAFVGVLVALAGGETVAGAAPPASHHGIFSETAAGAGLGYDLHGSAKMTITANGTKVEINISGLDPAKSYGSHLHNGTCAVGGGGHYQDIEGGATTPPNELWITSNGTTLTPNDGGTAHGSGTAPWVARTTSTQTNARSVVVHEPVTGTRIACADLT